MLPAIPWWLVALGGAAIIAASRTVSGSSPRRSTSSPSEPDDAGWRRWPDPVDVAQLDRYAADEEAEGCDGAAAVVTDLQGAWPGLANLQTAVLRRTGAPLDLEWWSDEQVDWADGQDRDGYGTPRDHWTPQGAEVVHHYGLGFRIRNAWDAGIAVRRATIAGAELGFRGDDKPIDLKAFGLAAGLRWTEEITTRLLAVKASPALGYPDGYHKMYTTGTYGDRGVCVGVWCISDEAAPDVIMIDGRARAVVFEGGFAGPGTYTIVELHDPIDSGRLHQARDDLILYPAGRVVDASSPKIYIGAPKSDWGAAFETTGQIGVALSKRVESTGWGYKIDNPRRGPSTALAYWLWMRNGGQGYPWPHDGFSSPDGFSDIAEMKQTDQLAE